MAPVTPVNATAASLLGLLHAGPMTGGDLVAAAGDRFGLFFSVTRSQVYRELPALTRAGLLRLGKQGPRASQQYVITAAGKRAFRHWIAAGGEADAVRSPVVLRLLYAGRLTARQRGELLRSARAAYTERLAEAQAAAEATDDPFERPVAEFAVAHTRAMLTLIDSVPAD